MHFVNQVLAGSFIKQLEYYVRYRATVEVVFKSPKLIVNKMHACNYKYKAY